MAPAKTTDANGTTSTNKAFWRILPVLHVREFAIGAAAINAMSQIGAFVAPIGWGIAKDAIGSFQAALIALSIVALAMAAVALLVRRQVHGRTLRPASSSA